MRSLIVVVFAMSIASCGKKDNASGGAPAPAAPPPATGDIGIAECDDYVAKMTACFPKMDAAMAGKMKQQLDLLAQGWKTAKGTPGLAANCKANLDAAKQQYASLGCAF